MGRLEELAKRKKRKEEQNGDIEEFWKEFCKRASEGQVIPIISNSMRTNRIFDVDEDEDLGVSEDTIKEKDVDDRTIEEELAAIWANQLGYPMDEKHKMAQVAQYNRVRAFDDQQAKTNYLEFLKKIALLVAEEDNAVDTGRVETLREELSEASFADIADALRYPRFSEGQADPLLILARLNLPIYVTTSYHGFMERALAAAGRQSRTQICYWTGEPIEFRPEDEDYRIDSDFVPTSEKPLVFHLFGFEKYPETLVLSEDDYLDFLVKISQDTSQEKPIIPLYLQKALTQSSLLLMGYRVQDWDFRVLYRGIIKPETNSLRKFSVAIQLNPKEQKGLVPNEDVQRYLEKYFGPSFRVIWLENNDFIRELWAEWERWR